ncbi:hypothetical protein SOM61_26255 [Massilia sp. CFBP9012]|nr:hypothetical protein [Massilia sp. CFBP9012]MDY0978473.1 hypothetical protein [Massilia sp. CFBP9012]
MQASDLTMDEFSIEILESRFEMEAMVEPLPETDWKSTCTYADLFGNRQ